MPQGELKREHFVRIELDKEHYYYSFGIPGLFDICLEPCAGGFDVALYDGDRIEIVPKQCINSDGYLISATALFGDCKDEDWNKALAIASEFLDKYTNNLLEKYKKGDWRPLTKLSRRLNLIGHAKMCDVKKELN